jgi:hypothetical protein
MHKQRVQGTNIGVETRQTNLATGYSDVKMNGGIIIIARILVQSQDTMLEDMQLVGKEGTVGRIQKPHRKF